MAPALPPLLRTGLPVLSYAGLGVTTVGAVKILVATGMTTGAAALAIGVPVLSPALLLLGMAALDGGPGMAKRMGGQPAPSWLKDLAKDAATAIGAGPPDHVYVIPSREPNAFAAGGLFGKKAVVAVTSGLVDSLKKNELRAVLAHEMGHLRHRDVSRNVHVAIAAAGLGGIYEAGKLIVSSSSSKQKRKEDNSGSIGTVLMGVGLTGQAVAHMLRLSASRRAELDADSAAAEAFGAAPMILALQKIEAAATDSTLRTGMAGAAVAHAMISDGGKDPQKHHSFIARALGAFRTHPSIDDRIAALKEKYSA